MSIWNKILLGLNLVAMLVLCYLAARTLKTQQYWEAVVAQHQKKLNEIRDENRELVEAKKLRNGNLGTNLARLELENVLLGRGRVWHNCQPLLVALDRQTGSVAVNVGQPDPHEIRKNTILYAMSEADVEKGGRYVGEFRVTDVADRKIQLVPTGPLEGEEIDRLAKSNVNKEGWIFYEVMPVDRHEAFADLKSAALKVLLPADSVREYEKDGQPAEPGDQPAKKDDYRATRVRDGDYVRRLRDYAASFERFRLERGRFADLCEAAERNKNYLEAASKDAEHQREFQQKVRDELAADKAAVDREVKYVGEHWAALKDKLAAIEYDVQRKLEANVALAKEIVRQQLDAARRIDERTRTVASGAGEK